MFCYYAHEYKEKKRPSVYPSTSKTSKNAILNSMCKCVTLICLSKKSHTSYPDAYRTRLPPFVIPFSKSPKGCRKRAYLP